MCCNAAIEAGIWEVKSDPDKWTNHEIVRAFLNSGEIPQPLNLKNPGSNLFSCTKLSPYSSLLSLNTNKGLGIGAYIY